MYSVFYNSEMLTHIFQKSHPLKQYCNKGFQWLSRFEQLLPVSGTTGSNAFTPSSSTVPPSTDDEVDDEVQLVFRGSDVPRGGEHASGSAMTASYMMLAAAISGEVMIAIIWIYTQL